MRMKAQLENLFCRPKVWLQFWKLGCPLGGRKQWTFLFIERWKNKYAKKCLFLTGSKTPSYFCLFSLRAWEHSTNVNWRCFIVPCVVLEVSDHGQQALAHLPAMQCTMRPLSAHVLWHGGDGNWMLALHSQGVGERPGHQMRGKGSVIFHPGETVVQDGWPRLRPLITEGGRCVSRLGEDRHFLVLVAQSLQSCPTLCDLMDCSPPGSSVRGTSWARILEGVAISSSRGSSWPKEWTLISCVGRWILYHLSHQGSPSVS